MKRYIFFFLLFFSSSLLHCQVKIGDNVDNIHSSAILELENSSKGLLISRLSTSEVANIKRPANGLIVYNTDLNLLQINIGKDDKSEWVHLTISKGKENKGALLVPVGNDSDRPMNPVRGMLRYNVELFRFEIYLEDWIALEV